MNNRCVIPLFQQLNYPRGRALGGSGTINYLSYTRGSRYDFDEWAELGCSGWTYRDVLPYMIKCEDNDNKDYVSSGRFDSRSCMMFCVCALTL